MLNSLWKDTAKETPKKDKTIELDKLVEENLRLREELEKLIKKSESEPSSTKGEKSGAAPENFYQQLQHELAKHSAASVKETVKDISSDDKSSKPSDPDCIESASKRAVIVCVPGKDEEDEDEVCVMDLSNIDWWTIVDSEKDRKTLRDDAEQYVECELTKGTSDDDDSYLLVDEKDLGDAFANFVAQTLVKQYPEAKILSPKQVDRLMENTFGELRPPSTLGKALRWGKLAYSSYGWACCAYNIYRDPTMVKLVAKGAYTACSWLIFFIF